jgi:DNA-binding NarL/FixJ family response regulator
MRENTKKEGNTLLLVDDDPNLILLVTDYLRFQGYEVLTAENGLQALEIINTTTPELIICDIMMPEMDGYSLVQKLRSDPDKQWIPVIFLSAKGQSNDRIKGLETGADVYMVKPFEPEELVAQVKSSLRQTDRLLKHSSKTGSLEGSFSQVPENIELTQTEIKVIQLVAQGLPNKEIAERLHVSQRTIESHVSNMLSKTNLNNRTELSRWAVVKNLA